MTKFSINLLENYRLNCNLQDLENEKNRLESELVAIATLDRQQSAKLEQLQTQYSTHGTHIEVNTYFETIN